MSDRAMVAVMSIIRWLNKESSPLLPVGDACCLQGSRKGRCAAPQERNLHCKNIWVTSTIFWSFQLHACCVRDTLQTSRNASNLIESLNVVEKLFLLVKLESCRKPSNLAGFLP